MTVAAVAVLVHAITTLIHEGVGHGGACLLVGCTPRLITSMQFQGDVQSLSTAAARIVAAGGSVANVVAGTLAMVLLLRTRDSLKATWFFLWLFATVNWLEAAGYPLYSGIANIGDWADVVQGFQPVWLWRAVLAIIGATAYWGVIRFMMSCLGRHLDMPTHERPSAANRYTLVAYATSGALGVLAGLHDPGGLGLVLISGVAASLGGTSALAWGPQLLHNPRLGTPPGAPLQVARDVRWIVAAAAVAIAFVFGLGHGIVLHTGNR